MSPAPVMLASLILVGALTQPVSSTSSLPQYQLGKARNPIQSDITKARPCPNISIPSAILRLAYMHMKCQQY
jgi:hypothetical protein